MNPGPLGDNLSPTEPTTSYDRRYSGAVLLDQEGNFILQARDHHPGIANSGKTTLFGGGQDTGETDIACLVRELREELGLKVEPAALQLLGYIDKAEADQSITRCVIFELRDINPATLHLNEGRAIVVQPAQAALRDPAISPVTKIAMQAAIEKASGAGP